MILLYLLALILLIILLIIIIFLAIKLSQLSTGRSKAAEELKTISCRRIENWGAVKKLSILPLSEYYSDSNELQTEAGVSYLVRADDIAILMDVGFNPKAEHPSPLLQNMNTLGIKSEEIDMVFISHLHLDHLGGAREQKERTFSISQGAVNLRDITVYSPDELKPSHWNPAPQVTVIKEPVKLLPGIASIGVIPRFLFLIGYTLEHSLAINVKGKGIVLIIGCGHQTIQQIIERTRKIFKEPIYGIIGGLHLPIKGGRIKRGPFNIQHIVASDNPPWKGLKRADTGKAIQSIKGENPRIVALSAHDSSDWSIAEFREAFGNRFTELRVGQEIKV